MKNDRILKTREVMEILGLSRTTLWKVSRETEGFPKARQIGPRRVGWLNSEIQKWIRNRPVVN
jgi:prophage regulatory protein